MCQGVNEEENEHSVAFAKANCHAEKQHSQSKNSQVAQNCENPILTLRKNSGCVKLEKAFSAVSF